MSTNINKTQIISNAVKQFNNVRLMLDQFIVSALTNPFIQSLIH
jgi:hypothetical protein